MVAALLVATHATCFRPTTFPCKEDRQCGPDGFCELTGACSFKDARGECDSGRRYGRYAPDGLSELCVETACPGNPIVATAIGGRHACVLRAGGQLSCWGANDDGQLGDGTTISRGTAAEVGDLPAVRAIALGDRHTCAVTNDGAVLCFGANEDGQLGDGTTISRSTPVAVTGLTGVVALAAGTSFTCALDAAGAVSCWGANDSGQLGTVTGATGPTGATTAADSTLPVRADTPALLTALSARDRHACGLGGDGTLYCWGANASGQLGDGTQTARATPAPVIGLEGQGVTEVATGAAHTCALADGRVWCWGANQVGQLGDGLADVRPLPAPVALLDGGDAQVQHIAAGFAHTCAVRADGSAWCWGANQSGQLGEGTTSNINVPVPVTGLGDAVDVAAGTAFSCARRRNDTLWCWGDNRVGQLGGGSAVDRLTSTRVANLDSVLSLTAGGNHTCARRPAVAGAVAVVCWGSNQAGELGDGTRVDRATPTSLKFSLNAVQVAAGAQHTCLRAGDSSVWCWGRGSSGQLGTQSLIDFLAPVSIPEAAGAGTIVAGSAHTCALRGTTVACWGRNDEGQLGDGTTTSRSQPADVLAAGSAVEVVTGGAHTCARRTDGTVACWGRNAEGQLGDGTNDASLVPVVVADLSGATALTAGANHTCALLADGTARCWGDGARGQLGWGSTAPRNRPAVVSGLGDIVTIAAGDRHTCARTTGTGNVATPGPVFCWGDNSAGQLGDGTRETRLTPPLDPVVSDGLELAAGARHTCAVRSDGSVACWGSDAFGQLGDAAPLQLLAPQPARLHCD